MAMTDEGCNESVLMIMHPKQYSMRVYTDESRLCKLKIVYNV